MTICKDITTQILVFDLDRFEFITDGKQAIWRNNPIPPDINAMPLEAHPLPDYDMQIKDRAYHLDHLPIALSC